uniref:Serpin domain-containing protein n=1 Tax=Panagrolaimus davidi TaxID=227884 RepID=A0A914QAB2_9BILA
MILAASDGNTAEEIVTVIGKGKLINEVLEYYAINKKLEGGKDVVQLSYANRFFVSHKTSLIPEFSNLMHEKFQSDVEVVKMEDKNIYEV